MRVRIVGVADCFQLAAVDLSAGDIACNIIFGCVGSVGCRIIGVCRGGVWIGFDRGYVAAIIVCQSGQVQYSMLTGRLVRRLRLSRREAGALAGSAAVSYKRQALSC